ncbi:hypothetical protein [Streptomyces sp. NPDC048473]|uniref:hypothetical protein n=1 Tax=unclassified Streptomyces TaxID=2593676 RepID=UPI0037105F7F
MLLREQRVAAEPEDVEQHCVELRLHTADGHVTAVGGAVSAHRHRPGDRPDLADRFAEIGTALLLSQDVPTSA